MTGIDLQKSQNYNEPGLTLHESVFLEILVTEFRKVSEFLNSKEFSVPGHIAL
ncbi:hypothetical protein T11_14328 [Trichinella zimbabwensis]|uniref:Uncharacterized protein n=1 Tax=Trichinella zimbabwensis TaxID=268475 RepID=A0A0V1GRX0_9BILA|nr:hypothetical protein T11_14328 [Trichinella zimbabwensis]